VALWCAGLSLALVVLITFNRRALPIPLGEFLFMTLTAAQFKRRCPDYLPTDSNYAAMVRTLAYNSLSTSEQTLDTEDVVELLIERGYWTAANLQAIYQALDCEGLLDAAAGRPRDLSERERLRVARMAQAGRVDEAISEVLRCSLDGDEPDLEMTHDPAYRDLCDTAVYEVFHNVELDYVETASRRAYLLRFAGRRPLTIYLLQQAWRSCLQNERRHERGNCANATECATC
jgi:hypothetical protein